MSFPKIPDIKPKIKLKRHDVINLLLSSIAFEELGLAHLINAEGEKLQELIKASCDFDDLINANRSVEKMLRTIIKKEIILQFKLENVLEIPDRKPKDDDDKDCDCDCDCCCEENDDHPDDGKPPLI